MESHKKPTLSFLQLISMLCNAFRALLSLTTHIKLPVNKRNNTNSKLKLSKQSQRKGGTFTTKTTRKHINLKPSSNLHPPQCIPNSEINQNKETTTQTKHHSTLISAKHQT